MRRSQIDGAIDGARELAAAAGMPLPGFAGWTRADWLAAALTPAARPALERGLGWDVTDFGRGEFDRVGLVLCTLRNGTPAERDAGAGQTYAEKFLVAQDGQETPMHLHRRKTEDIINRGGAALVVELRPESGDGDVVTLVDGFERAVSAGSRVLLEPGQSIQVPAGVYHRFWADGGVVLAGEVSAVNDDVDDNIFADPFPRYPSLDEDAPARYLLVSEYAKVLAG
ncbi:D-lyxose/D-mannose family sugar isomerase [Jiangella aurantiaca]|uniref:D-lyxose ketol-isomerase n=1 Tax=Jiangella aurantiaca TaxID=2530373 RepID=A0A4R5AFS9_9ACTN|nr:D-lyxose/D-mannose family sugar isomerase [Jiangella aurantiaca]TDD70089.1 D-lyxose/D-mannose family sugar isomerase [Jiangella aurantiaca]